MSTVRKYQPHYTVEDYRQWKGDWELWYGTAVAMSPSLFGPHERAVSALSYQIQNSIRKNGCNCSVYTGLDWIVQSDTVVRPDVMVVCGAQPERHLEKAPRLTIEILSDSTADKDRHAKRELYANNHVKHYLIADAAKKILAQVVPRIPLKAEWPEHRALDSALVTDRKLWPAETAQKLKPILGRFL